MIALVGGSVVLPDRIAREGVVLIDGSRIAAAGEAATVPLARSVTRVDVTGAHVVPGFIDVHVHGVEGIDTLDGDGAIARLAARLPAHGVTAFCPTTVACAPGALRTVLTEVTALRARPLAGARVLPAHLESNFLNPDYAGAQPAACLRLPPSAGRDDAVTRVAHASGTEAAFAADDILATIAAARAAVGIVTLAPELPGALGLIRTLVAAGHRVSLGHSGASFEEAMAAIAAGARQATHLFNRMPPLSHRAPGLVGAVLASASVAAELICDGEHVHPALCRVAIAAKGVDGIIAISDGTAGAGLPTGATARLGGTPIVVGQRSALRPDGTLAGSTRTMADIFRTLVSTIGVSLVEAARLCATTPARRLGLDRLGTLEAGAEADLVVLDHALAVRRTWVAGREVHQVG